MWTAIITILCTLPFGYFIWTMIHELSHLWMVKRFVRLESWSIKPYPHYRDVGDGKKQFSFAAVYWRLEPDQFMTNKQLATISLAPRIGDIIAVIALPFAVLFSSGVLFWIWISFWFCGLVDLFIGSLGIRDNSDLRRASNYLKINPWLLRIAGMGDIVLSVVLTVVLLIL